MTERVDISPLPSPSKPLLATLTMYVDSLFLDFYTQALETKKRNTKKIGRHLEHLKSRRCDENSKDKKKKKKR